ETARMLNPGIEIVARTHSDEEAGLLQEDRPDRVFIDERELAITMTEHVVGRCSADHKKAGH
ncbi:MAG: sodium:proton antiporter, partial [Betaproteobacteria bacterium]|nr:sodium:proton antiporter [Betaproteobacteria bacterium]